MYPCVPWVYCPLVSRHDMILVGINTVLKDNPRLSVRLCNGVLWVQRKRLIRCLYWLCVRLLHLCFSILTTNTSMRTYDVNIISVEVNIVDMGRRLRSRDILLLIFPLASLSLMYRTSCTCNLQSQWWHAWELWGCSFRVDVLIQCCNEFHRQARCPCSWTRSCGHPPSAMCSRCHTLLALHPRAKGINIVCTVRKCT